jgi:glucosamine--fructose-6-phosphate aminotransferase (isomerizing)
MTEMIDAEPGLSSRLLRRLAEPSGAAARLAEAVREAADAALPIVTTGCGTSEHGAMAVADLLADALGGRWSATDREPRSPIGTAPTAAQAFELALDPPSDGLVIGVSHEGGTWATNQALEAARASGARTALITVTDRSPGAALAEPGLVVATDELDQGWCHTVGYLSPILAGIAVTGHLGGRPIDAERVGELVAAGLRRAAAIEGLAARLADVERILVVASGADRTAGRELVLKLEEGTWVPSAYRDLETVLHGHWPATDASTGLVLVLAEPGGRSARVARARQALEAARIIGVRAGAILVEGIGAELDAPLTPAGRIVVPEAAWLPPTAAALLSTATPLQLLAERLARLRGTDPDPIRRDDPRYRDAAAAAEG